MNKKVVLSLVLTILLVGIVPLTFNVQQASPQYEKSVLTQWTRTYGGTGEDRASWVVQTNDGGYAIAGYTNSPEFDVAGQPDFWLVKTDPAGNMEWNQTYGGSDDDRATCVIQTSDRGYALTGYTYSYGLGEYDYWLVKTDDEGNKEWDRSYGGAGKDQATSIIQTSDGGYLIIGTTTSLREEGRDIWLVKTDTEGNVEWSKTIPIGSDRADVLSRVLIRTSDGGFALAGALDDPHNADRDDFLLVKFDANINLEWYRTYGGLSWEFAASVVQTDDGGYTLAGPTRSFGAGNLDYWLVKTDSDGYPEWNRTYGGALDDHAWGGAIQIEDGGYAIAGMSKSFGAGAGDFWLVKTDSEGNEQWNKTCGGTSEEWAYRMIQTSDGGYAIVGYTYSYGEGNEDAWLVKIKICDVTWGEGLGPYYITVFCNHSVVSFNFNKTNKQISLVITSDDPGFCNITIPRCRFDGPFGVTIDETSINYTLTQNEDVSNLNFGYTSGTHYIEVTGTERGYIIGDINRDGMVDVFDVVLMAMNFGHNEDDYS